jgi:hypothetical protein
MRLQVEYFRREAAQRRYETAVYIAKVAFTAVAGALVTGRHLHTV